MAITLDDFSICFSWLTQVYQNFIKTELKISKDNPKLEYVNSSLRFDSFDSNIQEGFELYFLIN